MPVAVSKDSRQKTVLQQNPPFIKEPANIGRWLYMFTLKKLYCFFDEQFVMYKALWSSIVSVIFYLYG